VEGIASDLFTPLALTVSFSLITSLIVAVTLVPMLSSKLLSQAMEDHGRRYWFNRFLDWVNKGYRNVLKGVLKYRKTTDLGTVVVIVASVALIPFIRAEFIPSADEGQMELQVEASPGASIEQMEEIDDQVKVKLDAHDEEVETSPGTSIEQMEEIVDQVNEKLDAYDEEVDTSFVSAGGDGMDMFGGTSNTATIMVQLIPATEREQSTISIAQALDEQLQEIPGAEIAARAMDSGMEMGDPVQIELSGPEHEVLRELADQVVEEISSV